MTENLLGRATAQAGEGLHRWVFMYLSFKPLLMERIVLQDIKK